MARRLFAFGCSFTSYAWPTWADLLGSDFDHFENWGLAGVGNRAIAERVAECHVRNKFNKDDVVIVQWSSHLRNDWWHQYSLPERKAHWKTAGSIFNYLNEPLYDKKWLKTFFFEPAYVMHSLNHLVMTQNLLEASGCTWFMTGMGDLRNMGNDLADNGWGGEDILLSDQDKVTEKVAWAKIPELKIYEKPIWIDKKDHWLTPLSVFAKKYPELIFDFVDTEQPSVTFKDTHPTTEHYALWIQQELQTKLSLDDSSISKYFDIANAVKKLHSKFKFNKQVFELMSAKAVDFPQNTGLHWPPVLHGF